MSKTEMGVLIFNEWFEGMRGLDAKDYKRLMDAIYQYQAFGKEPPRFGGEAKMVAAMIFPCIKRRMAQAEAGRRTMSARKKSLGFDPEIEELLRKSKDKTDAALDV